MKNDYYVEGGIAYIKVNGHPDVTHALIDEEDLPLMDECRLTWNANKHAGDKWYIVMGSHPKLRLHRVITDAPKGKLVDHLDGNTFDNRRSNLRVATHKENSQNVVRKGRALPRNVYEDKSCTKTLTYKVEIYSDGKLHFFGNYTDLLEASRVAEENRERLMPYLKDIASMQ